MTSSEPIAITRQLDCASILRSAGEAAYEWSIDTDALTWSDNAFALLGLRDAKAISTGRGYSLILDPGNERTRHDAVHSGEVTDWGTGVPYQVQYALRAAPRTPKLWIEDTGRWFAGEDGKPARAHGVIRVITDRHEHEQKLVNLTRLDLLTGEVNRHGLTEQLDQALREAIRAQRSCGFLIVNIDNLSRINDAFGYDIADQVIGAVARRLRSRMRSEDTIGRFSGNKFGLILRDCAPQEIGVAADRFLRCIRDDVVITTAGPVAVTVTIGGVSAPDHAGDVQEVISRAQEVLGRAKEKRPGSFMAYQPNVQREAIRRENIRATDKIVTALNERRIVLAYEPVADALSREHAFHECLIRIAREDGSLILANEIIPVAERVGLIRLLDQRVLELVIEDMLARPELRTSLNVSASSTLDPEWWARLEALLSVSEGVAERLIVEITENAAIHDIDNARSFVSRLKDMGVRIAIDDFGAGYTSFRSLRKLGVDLIKIDGLFVRNLVCSEDDRIFVRAMLDLARGLNLQTVAEWVQDSQTAAILADWGCDYLQGEYIGRAKINRPASALCEAPAEPLIRIF